MKTPLAHMVEAEVASLLAEGEASALYERLLAEVEAPLIQKSLEHCRGNQLKAAKLLGLNRNTLARKMKQLGLTASRRRA